MNDGAWQVLRGLEAWQITEFPRRPHARQNSAPDQDRADLGATQRTAGAGVGVPLRGTGGVRLAAGARGRSGASPGGRACSRGGCSSAGGCRAFGAGGAEVLTFPAGARATAAPARARLRTCWPGCLAGCGWPASPTRCSPGGTTGTGQPGCPAVARGRAAVRLVRAVRLAGARGTGLARASLAIWPPRCLWRSSARSVLTLRPRNWPRNGCRPGTPSCARPRRPVCGGSGSWPAARHRRPRLRSPGCCAPQPTWTACPTPWPRYPGAPGSRRACAFMRS